MNYTQGNFITHRESPLNGTMPSESNNMFDTQTHKVVTLDNDKESMVSTTVR